MKIMFVAQTPPPIHGAALINDSILTLLRNRCNVEVQHLNLSASNTIAEMQASSLIKAWRAFFRVVKFLLRATLKDVDLTYVNVSPSGLSSIRDYVFLVVASFRSDRVLAHFHGNVKSGSIFGSGFFKFLVPKKVEYIYLDKVLAVNALQPHRKCHFLPNFAPDEDRLCSLKNNKVPEITVGFLSNMLPAKGIWEFLDICANALRLGKKFSVLIGGDWTLKFDLSDYRNWLEENSDVADSFEHLGALNSESKVSFFSNINIFIYPSHNDAFPLVILEAMASRVAVISSNVGAIGSMLGSSSGIFEPSDFDGFLTRLCYLLDNPSVIESEGKRLACRYYAEFSERKFCERIFKTLGV